MNTEQLSKRLTYDEYRNGKDLFFLLREQDISAGKAAGMVYGAGYQAGKKESEEKLNREIGRLHRIVRELKEGPPEAGTVSEATGIEEGSNDNE